jgi:hypothetical protein
MYAQVGDELLVEGDARRVGQIVGVPHEDGSPPYIVKWIADGHIVMIVPGDFARVLHHGSQVAGNARDLSGAET